MNWGIIIVAHNWSTGSQWNKVLKRFKTQAEARSCMKNNMRPLGVTSIGGEDDFVWYLEVRKL